jgi:hypothetical protein
MIKNFLKIALRHLGKNKGYALINMIGLSLGMACAILILLWVNDEVQYNRFHQHYSNLYQMLETQSYDGKEVHVCGDARRIWSSSQARTT